MYEERRNNSGFRPRQSNFVPVNVGDEINVKIEAVGEKGDGVAKVKGFVLFVPGVKEGEFVKVRVNKVLRKVGFAEVIGQASAESVQKSSAEPAKKKEEEDTAQFEGDDSEDFGELEQEE